VNSIFEYQKEKEGEGSRIQQAHTYDLILHQLAKKRERASEHDIKLN
jgi:hypothetical protein